MTHLPSVEQTERRLFRTRIAGVYIGLGDKDQAFEWLEKDFQSRNATLPNFLSIQPFNVLHDDRRFKDLTRRIGLPELK